MAGGTIRAVPAPCQNETAPYLRLYGAVHYGIRFGMRRNHVLQGAVAAPPFL